MRGFSLTQPWASLVAIGAKQWETRSWPTAYRGQIAIHASKSYPRDCRELEYEEPFLSALKRGLTSPHMLPTASIIALATITDCRPTSAFREIGFTRRDRDDVSKLIEISGDEFSFGDYGESRYAFRIENVMRLPSPIECRGALSLWTIPDGVLAQIYNQLIDLQHEEAVRAEALGTAEILS